MPEELQREEEDDEYEYEETESLPDLEEIIGNPTEGDEALAHALQH